MQAHPFIYGRSAWNTSKVINGGFNHKKVVAFESQAKVNIKQKRHGDMITSNILRFNSLIVNFIKVKSTRHLITWRSRLGPLGGCGQEKLRVHNSTEKSTWWFPGGELSTTSQITFLRERANRCGNRCRRKVWGSTELICLWKLDKVIWDTLPSLKVNLCLNKIRTLWNLRLFSKIIYKLQQKIFKVTSSDAIN